ncbi:MAG TPA: sugar transferase [Panacibacter sp.]|nr:sugar transferase [Panacibacter sp.]
MITNDLKTNKPLLRQVDKYPDIPKALPHQRYAPGTDAEQLYLIRFFDCIISISSIILLSPLLLLIAVLIKITSKGSIIFAQKRVGKNEVDFTLYKFRTMREDAAEAGSLTIDSHDSRITTLGFFLRKHKLDELPQLYNVLRNEMSMVGPRPEVRKYVNFYSEAQRQMLRIKPGITDYASIKFRNENELLALQLHPEDYYIKEIIPLKIELNKQYAYNRTVKKYFTVIVKTFLLFFD